MLFVVFHLGSERYAVEAARVLEVIPLVRIRSVAKMPASVAGIIDYRGSPVPVVDLCQMALGRPCYQRLSTRILIIEAEAKSKDGAEVKRHPVGLVAERVTGTARFDPREFKSPGGFNEDSAFTGPLSKDGRGFIQWISIPKLLSQEIQAALCSTQVTVVS